MVNARTAGVAIGRTIRGRAHTGRAGVDDGEAETVVCGDVVVEAPKVLAGSGRGIERTKPVVDYAGQIRRWKVRLYIRGHRVDAARRDLIVRKWLTNSIRQGGWVVDQREDGSVGEIPRPHGRRRICFERIRSGMVDDVVVIEIEEYLVLPDRTANCAAKIVEVQHRHRGREEASRIEEIVFEVFVSRAVHPVRSALADLVQDRAADTILCVETRSTDLDLGDIFKHADIHVRAVRIGDLSAIGEPVVLIAHVPVHGQRCSGPGDAG